MRCPNGSRKKKGICVCKRGWTMIKGVCVPDVEQPAKRCPVNSKRIKGRCVCKNTYDMIRGFCVPKSRTSVKASTRFLKPLGRSLDGPLSQSLEKPKSVNKTNHAKIIQSRFRKSKQSLRSNYLKRHCPGSSECLILGQKRKEILQFFNGFKNLDYSDKTLTPIGVNSINGCVHELKFKHRDYISYAVLKTSKTPGSENLIYEYFMGLFINKVNEYLPSFLETYGVYNCSPEFHDKLISKEPLKFNKEIVPLIATNTELIKIGCANPLYNQILIQHVKNAETLFSKIKDTDFLKNDLKHVLFQVYAALYCLRGNFTHFDLHANNILLQKPFPTGVMEFHYDDIVFNSPYLVKIIDYGRSESSITPDVMHEVCKLDECKPDCGKHVGFSSSNLVDETTDVKLLHKLRDNLPKRLLDHIPEELLTVFNSKNLSECYEMFYDYLKDNHTKDNLTKINGILRIDTQFKKPFEFIKN